MFVTKFALTGTPPPGTCGFGGAAGCHVTAPAAGAEVHATTYGDFMLVIDGLDAGSCGFDEELDTFLAGSATGSGGCTLEPVGIPLFGY